MSLVPIEQQKTSRKQILAIYNEPQIIKFNNGFVIDTSATKSRHGDPLRLGVIERPPPPPDTFVYDKEHERKNGTASLLSDKDYDSLTYYTIEDVRYIVANDMSKETTVIDPELIVKIDQRIDYRIFISDGNVYTRDELFATYALQELGQLPEELFAQQLIGVFKDPHGYSYIAKDEDDESLEFVSVRDLMTLREMRKKNPDYEPRRPDQVIFTKVYIAKEAWMDYLQIEELNRAQIRLARNRIRRGERANVLIEALTL